jgi:hypothetical protein
MATLADVPPVPGLYRARRVGRQDLDYLGQTGRNLRERLGALRAGAYATVMPYRDPHTAAPALWALRHSEQAEWEVSFSIVDQGPAARKGLEALAITLYRREHGVSPTVCFGRMPPRYRPSSPNNARAVAAGRRTRGGPDTEASQSPPSVPVHGDPGGAPASPDWVGWRWTPWQTSSAAIPSSGLIYVGKGRIQQRIASHLRRSRGDHRQSAALAGDLEQSWVDGSAFADTQLLEHENDLIAAHVLVTGAAPLAQFLG